MDFHLNPRNENDPFNTSSSATVLAPILRIQPIHVAQVPRRYPPKIRAPWKGYLYARLYPSPPWTSVSIPPRFPDPMLQLGAVQTRGQRTPTKRPVETHLSGAIKDAATENDATGCDCFVSFLLSLSFSLCSVGLSLLQPPRLDNNEGEAVQIRVHWPRNHLVKLNRLLNCS